MFCYIVFICIFAKQSNKNKMKNLLNFGIATIGLLTINTNVLIISVLLLVIINFKSFLKIIEKKLV